MEEKVSTDNFLDFTTFFSIIQDNTSLSNEQLFMGLTDFLYDISFREVKAYKDEVSDILRKKKAFHKNVREKATNELIEDLRDDLKENLFDKISNRSELEKKLLHMVKVDEVFFDDNDVANLCLHTGDLCYVISYILIQTVYTSNKSKNMKHSDDYNPFKNYHNIEESSEERGWVKSNVAENISITSKYLRDKYVNSIDELMLSNGDIINIQRDDDVLKNSFSIVSDVSGNVRPLQDFMESDDNLIIVGEGGIGKTTALYSYMKGSNEDIVPIYVRLSDCSTYTDHRHMILNYIIYNMQFAVKGRIDVGFKDLIDEFSDSLINNQTKYVLLLDGFNEITTMDMGEIRYSIAKEINEFLNYKNVRMILTTREGGLYGIEMSKFQLVKATGIKKTDVIDFLQNKFDGYRLEKILSNDTLIQYLRIPLFLKMFTYTEMKKGYLPRTRGEILFNYYNGVSASYTEKNNRNEKNDIETKLMVELMLDFVLPQIGFSLTYNDRFYLSIYDFELLVSDAKDYILKLIDIKRFSDNYNTHTYSSKKVISIYEKMDYNDVLLLLSDGLGVLYKDAEDRVYFCHQYVRDYFSALYCVNDIIYISSMNNKMNLDTVQRIYWDDMRWSEETLIFICEVLSAYTNYNHIDILERAIDAFRFYMYEDYEHHFALSNIINALSLYNNGDLSEFDFSNLNLNECRLSNINFSNPYTGKKASFSGSKISQGTFSPEEHSAPVKAWSLSDEGHFIVSIDEKMEFKIWDISSQRCIHTSKLTSGSYYEKIGKIKYIESINTLLVVSLDAINESSVSLAWTYNTINNADHYYYTQNPESEKILYFDYDYFQEKYVVISDKPMIYWYREGNEIPRNGFPVNPCFANRLSKQLMDKTILDNYDIESVKDLFMMDSNKILYIESDVLTPFIHTISDEVYRGPEYALEDVVDENEINNLSKIEFHGARHINIFLYDWFTGEIIPLQLEGFPNEITSLVVNSNLKEDVIHDYIAVSNDRRKIAIHNQNDIYVYNLGDEDGIFKNLGKLPGYVNRKISFCNSSNILTLWDDSLVLHYDIDKKSVVREIAIGQSSLHEEVICTQNYRLVKIPNEGCIFDIENLYSEKDNILCIDDNCRIVLSFSDWDNDYCIYMLYSNGTLMCFNGENMRLMSCYNISVGMYVHHASYSVKKRKLCIAVSPYHSHLLTDDMKIAFFDVDTGNVSIIPNKFNGVSKVYFSDNCKQVLVFNHTGVGLIDVDNLCVTSYTELWKNFYNSPVSIEESEDSIYAVYSINTVVEGVRYSGVMYKLDAESQNDIKIIKKIYIPEVELTNIESPIFVKQDSDNSSLCWIKAMKSCDFTVEYVDDEGNRYEKGVDDWVIVYLKVDEDVVIESGELLPLRNEDYHVLKETLDSYLMRNKDDYYVYKLENDSLISFSIGNSKPVLYNNDSLIVYLMDLDSEKIYKYDIKEGRSPSSSSYLHPNILTFDCNFDGLKGYTGSIPRYMIHRS